MNILLIQENGHHDENRNFRECFCLQRSFSKLGHSCDVWGNLHDNFETVPDWESYDWIINLEQYNTKWVPSLADVKSPKKFIWSIDAHFLGEEQVEKNYKEGNYDYILHSTKDFVKEDHHSWFANAYDDSLIFPMDDVDKTIDVGFCGSYANRKELLEHLQKEYGLHLDIFVIGNSMVKAVNSYKCHFNLNISNDINYRSFETIGCGTVLLTNYNPQYEELGFEDGVNCLMYNDEDSLTDYLSMVKYKDMEDIAKAGLELAKKHTYDERVKSLLEKFDIGN